MILVIVVVVGLIDLLIVPAPLRPAVTAGVTLLPVCKAAVDLIQWTHRKQSAGRQLIDLGRLRRPVIANRVIGLFVLLGFVQFSRLADHGQVSRPWC